MSREFAEKLGHEMVHRLIDKLRNEVSKGIGLEKCKKCGCMKDALVKLEANLPKLDGLESSSEFSENLKIWKAKMQELKYK